MTIKIKPNGKTFSAHQRNEMLRKMSEKQLDILVIGGGITGAGIALDASLRGLNVGLVEMQDFAGGTSSRSTKLVHGGLRYLKNLQLGVVAEVGRERQIVYENGPHVTTPEWMLLPLYKGGSIGKLSTSIGLRLYDALAGVKRSERRLMLSVEQTIVKEPLLKTKGLKGGGYYVEYRTDDARLTIEVLKKAIELGAAAANYARVDHLLYDNDKVIGVAVTDLVSRKVYEIHAKKVINAAGPWVDNIREMDRSKRGKTLRLTKGVHLVFDRERFPLRQAVYFDTADRRMVFAIPREGKTYFGTTDTNYKGNIANPRTAKEDREYLLHAANDIFPKLNLTDKDIESSWAGLRPLIQQEGKSPSEISRRDEIFISNSGLISIAGGKLTGYRKMAEDVVNKTVELMQREGLARHIVHQSTRHIPISGGDFGGSVHMKAYVKQKIAEGVQLGLSSHVAQHLAERYGTNVNTVFALSKDAIKWGQSFQLPPELAIKLRYSIDYEMAVRPVDFFVQRTGNMFFRIKDVQQWKQQVVQAMASEFHWSEDERKKHLTEVERKIAEATDAGVD